MFEKSDYNIDRPTEQEIVRAVLWFLVKETESKSVCRVERYFIHTMGILKSNKKYKKKHKNILNGFLFSHNDVLIRSDEISNIFNGLSLSNLFEAKWISEDWIDQRKHMRDDSKNYLKVEKYFTKKFLMNL